MSIYGPAMEKCEIYRTGHQDAAIKWDSSGSEPFIKDCLELDHTNPFSDYHRLFLPTPLVSISFEVLLHVQSADC